MVFDFRIVRTGFIKIIVLVQPSDPKLWHALTRMRMRNVHLQNATYLNTHCFDASASGK